ncbi:MAG: PAS domain S-box protein [Actinobacteria bacterium]|nr:PAS domain S-box protein [Actinomycetota bacterium]
MNDKHETGAQPFNELKKLRKRISELESLEVGYKKIIEENKKLEVERFLIFDRLIKENEDLSFLTQVTENVISTLELDKLLKVLIDHLVQVSKADIGVILLKENDRLHYKTSVGLDEAVYQDYVLTFGKGFSGIIAETMKPLYIEDAQTDERVIDPFTKQRGIRSMLGVPLKQNANFIGVLHIDWLSNHPFNERELHLLESTTGRCARAILNSQLYEKTKELKERLQLQIDRMPLAYIFFDTDYLIQGWNPAAEKIFGFSEDEVLGKHPYKLIVPEEARAHVNGIWSRILEGDMSANSINENITKDGRKIICDWTNTPIKKEDGTVIGLISMIKDITEQKQAEEALKKSEYKYHMLVENLQEGIWAIDADYRTTYVNQRLAEMLGYHVDEMLGKSLFSFIDESVLNVAKKNMEHRKKGISEQLDFEFLRKDGDKIYVTFTSSPVMDDGGNFIGAFACVTDITNRKKAEDELRQSYEKLDKTLDSFILAMAATIEMRDPYTSGHQRRVADIASKIAKRLDLKENQIQGIRMAALIHDIGKIVVPSEILSKPGRITENEFNIIKSHPKVGFDILNTIEFPLPIAKIVLQHHERMNGSGYPNRNEADKICIEARILAVADVIEAMSSHRPYRPALGIDKAIEEISNNRGILYDTEIVDVCLMLYKKGTLKSIL